MSRKRQTVGGKRRRCGSGVTAEDVVSNVEVNADLTVISLCTRSTCSWNFPRFSSMWLTAGGRLSLQNLHLCLASPHLTILQITFIFGQPPRILGPNSPGGMH
jgi:hypothetical protein